MEIIILLLLSILSNVMFIVMIIRFDRLNRVERENLYMMIKSQSLSEFQTATGVQSKSKNPQNWLQTNIKKSYQDLNEE